MEDCEKICYHHTRCGKAERDRQAGGRKSRSAKGLKKSGLRGNNRHTKDEIWAEYRVQSNTINLINYPIEGGISTWIAAKLQLSYVAKDTSYM
jgi:hypothetical protein